MIELIKRIKLHLDIGYNFGEMMRNRRLSQEMWESVIKSASEVIDESVLQLLYEDIHHWFNDFDSSKYRNTQINNYLKGTVNINGKKYRKNMGIDGHNDNPVTDEHEYKGIYHFDYPIYMICIQGSGVFSCGVHQQSTQYDATQQYRTIPNSLIRFEGYSAWNAYHTVQRGSIDDGDRIMMMIRPYHKQLLEAMRASSAAEPPRKRRRRRK